MKIDKIIHKFAKLDNSIYKSYLKYIKDCNKFADFLKKHVVNFDESTIHSFYVDYFANEGLALRICMNSGINGYVCKVNDIIELFEEYNRKLTIEEIIEHISF